MIRIARTVPLLAVTFALAACSLDLYAPRTELEGLPEGLSVQFAVSPQDVHQHEAFTATLRVVNTTDETIHVTTAHGCLVLPHVYSKGKRIPFQGSWWGCTAAITTHTFEPGEPWERSWEMRATLYAEKPGDVEGAPAPKGTYHVGVEFDTYPEQHTGQGGYSKPVIERTLRVR